MTISPTQKDQEEFDTTEATLKLWEKTIDVQMHFNELQMKVRNFAILLISSLVGVGGIAMKEHISIVVPFMWGGTALPLATVLFGIAAFVWAAFFFMDHYWYFPLLKGAVAHGAAIEKEMSAKLPAVGLTTAIGRASPIAIQFSRMNRETRKKEPVVIFNIHSQHKSFLFYGSVFLLLTVLTFASCSPSANAPPPSKQHDISPSAVSNNSNTSAFASMSNISLSEGSKAQNACHEREQRANHIEINQTFVNGTPTGNKQGAKASASATATSTSSALSKTSTTAPQSTQGCD